MDCETRELIKCLASKADVSCVQDMNKMHKKEKILKQHAYEIWEGKDGKWYTYLPDKEKGRKLKKRISKEKIEEDIVNYYLKKIENPTIEEVFTNWLSQKIERSEITKATSDRYIREFNTHFKEFGKKNICDVSEDEIESFMLSTLHKNQMTSKAYSNFRTLICGIFRYAKNKKYISYSIKTIVGDMDISRKSYRKNIKRDEEQVFMEDELPKFIDYLKDNADIINKGLLLASITGIRVGELAALKREDVSNTTIYVHRTEISYKDENGKNVYVVRDKPKTDAANREIIISQKYAELIECLKTASSEDFLFSVNGKRIKTYQFRNRLRSICKKLNIVNKSPHKIRKTYATILLDAGAQDSFVKEQMGHADIMTTRQCYYSNRKRNTEKQQIINNIFNQYSFI